MTGQLWAMAAAVAAMGLAGCASQDKANGHGVLQVQQDGAHGAKTVAFGPQPMACARQPQCPVMAVRWSSATPARAVLLLGFEYGGAMVDQAVFHTSSYGPQRVQSRAKSAAEQPGLQAFDVPMATLERIAFSKDVWVTVHTGERQVQEVLYNTQGGSAADEALKRLMVEAYQGTDKAVQMGLSSLFASPDKR